MQFDQKLARTGPQLDRETLAKQRMKKGTSACKPESYPQISCDVSQLQIWSGGCLENGKVSGGKTLAGNCRFTCGLMRRHRNGSQDAKARGCTWTICLVIT